jgi:hypothetical protein
MGRHREIANWFVEILGVVLGCHYTNTPVSAKDQVTAVVNGDAIHLAGSNAVLRTGDGDR